MSEIRSVELAPYLLPLRRPWQTAAGIWRERHGWLVRVTLKTGDTGYGDCAPWPIFGTETVSVAESALSQLADRASGKSPDTLLDLVDGLHGAPAARFALETALLDLDAQARGLPLYRALSSKASGRVAVNAFVGVIDDSIGERVAEAIEAGFTVLKVKLMGDPKRELPALERLSSGLPPAVRWRLDANRSWCTEDLSTWADALSALPVEQVEEPLRVTDATSFKKLQDRLPFPVALDESVSEVLGPRLDRPPPVRRLVLKPMVLGGSRACLGLARRAAAWGTECIVTTTVESAVGTYATAHLAAAVGNGCAHGLATGVWLARDLGPSLFVAGGEAVLTGRPGIGIVPGLPDPDHPAIRSAATEAAP